jgi:cell wall-associated NlpC family hydrolase
MATADQAINSASKYLGARYKLGGITFAGIDCSGLIYKTFADIGAPNEVGGRRKSYGYVNWAKDNGRFTSGTAGMQRGDLIVYDSHDKNNRVDHIALYEGNGRAISALINPWGVSEHNINLPKENIVGYIRPEYTSEPTGTLASDPTGDPKLVKLFNWMTSPTSGIAASPVHYTYWKDFLAAGTAVDPDIGAAITQILNTAHVDPNSTVNFNSEFSFMNTLTNAVHVPTTGVPNSGNDLIFGPIITFINGFVGDISHAFYFLIFILIGLVLLYVGFKQKGASNE